MKSSNTFFQANDSSILSAHKKAGEIRLIESSVQFSLKEWLKYSNKGISLLEDILKNFDDLNYPGFKHLPEYIRNLLENPRKSIPSLNKEITQPLMREIIRQTIQNILKENQIGLKQNHNAGFKKG